MNLDQLHDGFRTALKELTGAPDNFFRVANQNAPVGESAYASVFFSTLQHTGQDTHEFVPIINTDQITEIVIGQRILNVSVQYFGANAVYNASRLKTLLTIGKASTKLKTIGLGFIKSSQVRDLSVPVDTYFEPRGQIDLEFHLIAKETDVVETYGTFPIEMETENILTNSEVYEP